VTEYLYYPGCSVKGAGQPYERSLLAVFRALGQGLTEIDDWNCCGATAYLSVDQDMALLLASRNLALAERAAGKDVVAPCSGCFLALTKAQETLKEYPEHRARVVEALGRAQLAYRGTARVRHPLEVLLRDVGAEEIQRRVKRPLKHLRVAPYYGCAILRPYQSVDDAHTPHVLEDLIRLTGATAVDFAHKSRCCGGMLTTGVQTVGLRLVEILLDAAKQVEADVIVTTCPLCQYNLEVYQDRLRKVTGNRYDIPILYFTQLLGLALGLSDAELGMDMLLRVPVLAAVKA